VPFNEIKDEAVLHHFGPGLDFKSLGGYPFVIGVHVGYQQSYDSNVATRLTINKMRWLRD
jgi:hypothetical protein